MTPLRIRTGVLSIGLGLLLLQAGPARAGQLAVNPVQIKLDADAPTELLSLRNAGAGEARYEIHAYAWAESPEGDPKLTPTDDVMVFPPVLSLAPGEARNVRIGTAAGTGAVEKTYRIIVDELPPAERPKGVALFLNRISIPVFVAPAAPQIATTVEGAGAAKFRLRNTGNVHVRPRSVSAKAIDARGATVTEKVWAGWYVLPGGDRLYSVSLPPKTCASVRTLEVTVQTDGHDLHRTVATPQGACGT